MRYKVVTNICDFCTAAFWEVADKHIREQHPGWFAKSGFAKPRYTNLYFEARREEFFRSGPPQTRCCEMDFGNGVANVCLEHLLDMVNLVQKCE